SAGTNPRPHARLRSSRVSYRSTKVSIGESPRGRRLLRGGEASATPASGNVEAAPAAHQWFLDPEGHSRAALSRVRSASFLSLDVATTHVGPGGLPSRESPEA